MAFQDFVKPNGWKIHTLEGAPPEECGHTIKIEVKISCEESSTHVYENAVYLPDRDMIQGKGFQIRRVVNDTGKPELQCCWNCENGTQTPSWTAEDKGGNEGEG